MTTDHSLVEQADHGRLGTTGIAHRLADAVAPFVGGELPVRLRAWDGSEAGSPDGPLVVLHSIDAVRRLLWHPGELGAAQAYVTGELDVPEVDGWDLDKALTYAFAVAKERGLSGVRPSPSAIIAAVRAALDLKAISRPPAAPASQANIKGRLHSALRDRRAISHHYDLSNEFYSLILEPHMAYSSGYHSSPDQPLQEAQEAKLDLVLTKLGVTEGSTLLDIGCGWGSMSLRAAEKFGARVVGVTIAAEQKKFIDARIAERGLGDLVEIKLCDYRDVVGEYDAVASIGGPVKNRNIGLAASRLAMSNSSGGGGTILEARWSCCGSSPMWKSAPSGPAISSAKNVPSVRPSMRRITSPTRWP